MTDENIPVVNHEQLKLDIAINDANLDGCMIAQPSLYLEYARLYIQAQQKADIAKLKTEITNSQLDAVVRKQLLDEGLKLTEGAVAAMIARDPKHVRAEGELIRLRSTAAIYKQALEAFMQRRDMLIQLGASAREEMKGQLRTLGDPVDQLNAKKQAAMDRLSAKPAN
jgi:hypothetical protein